MYQLKKIEMDWKACDEYACTENGRVPLVQPELVVTSSKDPNRGLYPRPKRPRKDHGQTVPPKNELCGFQSARSLVEFGKETRNPGSSKSALNIPVFRENSVSNSLIKRSTFPKESTPNSALSDSFFSSFSCSPTKKKQRHIMKVTQSNSITNYFKSSPKKDTTPSSKLGTIEHCPVQSTLPASSTEDIQFCFNDDSDFDETDLFSLKDKQVEKEEPFSFYLPAEIMEEVFSHISVMELMLNCRLVCKHWCSIIDNPHFMHWKKMYYKYKSESCQEVVEEVSSIAREKNMTSYDNCILGLLEYMTDFRPKPIDLMIKLKDHEKYPMVFEIISKVCPSCITEDKILGWSLVAGLCVFAESMWEIYKILAFAAASQVSNISVSEALYCIALFLLHFKLTFKINHGLHYRVFYALHLFENQYSGTVHDLKAVQRSHTGQQNIYKYGLSDNSVKFTHEQMRIINHTLQKGDTVLIIAFAGTGKTSTLVEYARMRPGFKFLNIVYNRSVCNHASKIFTKNVECRTMHSLAYQSVGHKYRHKMTQKLRVLDTMQQINKPDFIKFSKQKFTKCVISTLENYISSPSEDITLLHSPLLAKNEGSNHTVTLTDAERLAIVSEASKYWTELQDANNLDARITHDIYLKLYQLSKPVLFGYDCIFVDESQDCSPAMLDVVTSQKCPKILVGDPNQQIYAFRKAINALACVHGTHTYYLTKSFRFGPEISYVASCALEVMKNVHSKTIVGTVHPGKVDGSIDGQIAIITRCNLTLYNEAVRICCRGDYSHLSVSQVRAAFEGGVGSYNLDRIVDIYRLLSGAPKEEIKDRFIRRFESFHSLKAYAKVTEDAELLGKISFVHAHHGLVPEYIQKIKNSCKYDTHFANVIFTTAHKAKGLEYDTVILGDDYFIESLTVPVGTCDETENEKNILYVAITRAKKRLCLSSFAFLVISRAREAFEYLVPSSVAFKEHEIMCCCYCHDVFIPSGSVVLYQRKMKVGSTELPGGPMCKTCAVLPYHERSLMAFQHLHEFHVAFWHNVMMLSRSVDSRGCFSSFFNSIL